MNQIVGGHGGLQDPALGAPGEVWISRDYEDYGGEAGGAQVQMIARSGRVTLFQLRSTPGGWQAVAASGITLESRPAVEGFPHALVRLDTPVVHFLNRLAEVGTTHHWIMAYGSVLDEIEAFCQIEQIPLEILRY
jgi:L-fucose isomerase-like protein